MTSITEALDKFFKPDLFEGDNKLYCDMYQTKINAKKSCRLGDPLPPTMVIMLKRFEYDMTTYTRYKLNDYFEFPLELNLSKWAKKAGDDHLEGSIESENSLYKLKGVLVHSGTSEFGHYYSYILVNGKWIEFNDTKVHDFELSEASMKTEWYGGDNGVGMFPLSNNSKSAYMLFYEKQKLDGEMAPQVDLKNEPISEDVREEIEASNQKFLRLKTYSDSSTLRYLNDLVSKLDRDDGID